MFQNNLVFYDFVISSGKSDKILSKAERTFILDLMNNKLKDKIKFFKIMNKEKSFFEIYMQKVSSSKDCI